MWKFPSLEQKKAISKCPPDTCYCSLLLLTVFLNDWKWPGGTALLIRILPDSINLKISTYGSLIIKIKQYMYILWNVFWDAQRRKQNHLFSHHLEIITQNFLTYILTDYPLHTNYESNTYTNTQLEWPIHWFITALTLWTEISEMELLMSWGPEVETGDHGGSGSYARPYLDGTWTFRWCQPQLATSAAMLRLRLISMNSNVAKSTVTYPI